MPDTLTAEPVLLAPSGDRSPVEQAVVASICDDFDPETFLWLTFRTPDGGARVWYAWTAGGTALGERIDQVATAAGYDCADYLHITNRHLTEHQRGRVKVQAHPLRPIQADVADGLVRAPEELRDTLRRIISLAATNSGQHHLVDNPRVPRWLGVGPTLTNRRD